MGNFTELNYFVQKLYTFEVSMAVGKAPFINGVDKLTLHHMTRQIPVSTPGI